MAKTEQMNRVAAFGVFFVAVALLLYMVLGSLGSFGQVNDFPEYSTAAHLTLKGEARKIYRLPEFFAEQSAQYPILGKRNVALFLPPFDLPLLIPMAVIPPAVAPFAWTGTLAVFLIASLWLLKRYYKLSTESFLLFAGMVLLSGPAFDSLRIGQLAPILLMSLVGTAMLLKGGRPVAAGAVFSLMLLKPQQMWPLLLFFIGARAYRTLGTVVGIASLLTIVSFVLLGTSGFMDYIATVRDPNNMDWMASSLTYTIRGQLLRLLSPSPVPGAVATACLLASSAYAVFLGNRVRDKKNWFEIGLVGALPIGLLTSLHCHAYDLLLLVPSFLSLFTLPNFAHCKKLKALAMLTAIAFIAPFYSEIHYKYLLNGGVINPYVLLLAAFSLGCAVTALANRDVDNGGHAGDDA